MKPYMKMFLAVWKAESLRLLRSPFFLLFSLAMPLGFYFLFAGLNGVDTPLAGTTWGVYSLMSMTAFSLIGTAVGQFGIRLSYERRDGWAGLVRMTPLPASLYIAGKIVSTLGVSLAVIAVLFPSAAIVYNLQLSAWQWAMCALWLWLGSVPFVALGALLGAVKNADAAVGIGNGLLMGLAVAGGLWMPLDVLPSWLQAIGKWLPSHSYAGGAWNVLAGGLPDARQLAILLGFGAVFMIISSYIQKNKEAL